MRGNTCSFLWSYLCFKLVSSATIRINFTCENNWAMGYPDIRLDGISRVSVQVFLHESMSSV